MANEPTTVTEDTSEVRVPFGKTANPTDLVYPLDATGFTTMVRKEGARAVGRIGGDPDRLAVFIATLKVLGEHARMKMTAQQEAQAEVRRVADALEAEAAELAAANARVEVVRLEKLLEDTAAALAAVR